MKSTDQIKVLTILDRVIPSGDKIEWKEITNVIASEMKISNWMHVRGVLQFMKDNGMITRFPDVTIEAYTKAPNPKKTLKDFL